MKVYDIRREGGELHAFEVNNVFLSRRRAARVVAAIPGARIVRAHAGWFAHDDFCEFELNGARFVVEEPFGDNSRYVIAPKDPQNSSNHGALNFVRAAFVAAPPGPGAERAMRIASWVTFVLLVVAYLLRAFAR